MVCDAGETSCDGRCVALASDPAHCGACKAACPPGSVCSKGECAATCAESLVDCGRACVDAATTSAHCGACDNACPTPAHGRVECEDGVCAFECDAGFRACGSECVDLHTDAAHCGACGIACDAPANGTAVCVDGACSFTCNAGFARCDGLYSSDFQSRPSRPAYRLTTRRNQAVTDGARQKLSDRRFSPCFFPYRIGAGNTYRDLTGASLSIGVSKVSRAPPGRK